MMRAAVLWGLAATSILMVSASLAADTKSAKTEIQELERRAGAGEASARFELGLRYDRGRGVRKNRKKAEQWYRLAAEAGHSDAQNSMGSMAQQRSEYAQARAWYEKAAAQAHAQGTHNLAYLYDLGLGVPQDRQRAKALYTSAATMGWGEAMWNLANMAAVGQAGPVDKFAACVWTLRALASEQAAEGSELRKRAERGMQSLRARLPAEEVERCSSEAAVPLASEQS